MPSSPSAQACRNIASPAVPDMCSEKRSAGPAFLSAFCSIRRRPISSTRAQVLSLKPEQVEGVGAGGCLPVIAEQPVKVGQYLEAVRHGLAVEHDAGGGEGAHGLGDRHEVVCPVAAVP